MNGRGRREASPWQQQWSDGSESPSLKIRESTLHQLDFLCREGLKIGIWCNSQCHAPRNWVTNRLLSLKLVVLMSVASPWASQNWECQPNTLVQLAVLWDTGMPHSYLGLSQSDKTLTSRQGAIVSETMLRVDFFFHECSPLPALPQSWHQARILCFTKSSFLGGDWGLLRIKVLWICIPWF